MRRPEAADRRRLRFAAAIFAVVPSTLSIPATGPSAPRTPYVGAGSGRGCSCEPQGTASFPIDLVSQARNASLSARDVAALDESRRAGNAGLARGSARDGDASGGLESAPLASAALASAALVLLVVRVDGPVASVHVLAPDRAHVVLPAAIFDANRFHRDADAFDAAPSRLLRLYLVAGSELAPEKLVSVVVERPQGEPLSVTFRMDP